MEIGSNGFKRSDDVHYLFAGSDKGGEWAAAIYSLVRTAKLNGLNPQAHLAHVLSCIGGHRVNRVGELLPWNVATVLKLSPPQTLVTEEKAA